MTDLIQRCEQADEGMQRELLVEAWQAVSESHDSRSEWRKQWRAHWRLFARKLDADAFVDAALMLVPEGMRDEIAITTLYQVARVEINMNHGPDGSPFYGSNVCNLIAMAIVSAAFKAREAGRG